MRIFKERAKRAIFVHGNLHCLLATGSKLTQKLVLPELVRTQMLL